MTGMTGEFDREPVLRLTPSQQGLLLQTVAGAEAGVYVNQIVVTLHGPLRPDVLRDSWAALLRRHEALRAGFVWQDLDEPLQAIRADVRLPWTEMDWREHEPVERDRRLAQLLAADRGRPFDLARPPLLRLVLIRVGYDEWCLVWTVHHLLVDGWSMAVAMREVLDCYHARAVVPDPLPYRAYVDWLYAQEMATAEKHWRRVFTDFGGPVPAPAARAVPDGPDGVRVHQLTLSGDETAALTRFSRANRLTPATVLTAAWGILLSRYARQADVVFGSVVSGRPPELPGVANAVGLFSTTLPVRLAVDEQAGLVQWLGAVQAGLAEARQFEYSSLTDIAAWAGAAGAAGLFDTVVAWENYPSSESAETTGGVQVGEIRTFERPHYTATLTASGGDRLTLRLFVDERRYADGPAERLLVHLRGLLNDIAAAQADARLADVALSGAAERRAVLDRWASGPAVELGATTMAEQFRRQVARTPEAPALIQGERTLTYKEVGAQVNRLARFLRDQGVLPETPVAVCMPNCVELPIAIHAVIAAGAVVVPIDPRSPAARVESLLRSSDCRLLLTTAATTDGKSGARTIAVDDPEVREAIEAQPIEPLEVPGLGPDNAVYVIHTSGSTGEPKGVVATHRGVLNHLAGWQTDYPIGPGDRVAQKTSVGFDMSVWELYWPLLNGAALLVLEAGPADPEELSAEITRWGGNVLSVVPTLLEAMLADPDRRFPPHLRILIIAGEALPLPTLARLRTLYRGIAANGYGPTETSVVSVAWPIPGEAPAVVPIGRPVDNTFCYPLDGQLSPVPGDVPGELYIGGAGLARGYLNRPALTAERFLPDPFGPPGSRMYRTGDVVRWLPTGELDYLGRSDLQVKINGFRIELGEVELTMEKHPAVARAVAVVRPHGDHKQLIGYAQSAASGAVSEVDLRSWLSERLPPYMVPAALVWLDSFPETASGKIDRKALPDPVSGPSQEASTGPRTPAERALAEVWSDVLGVTGFGVNDNFFELGGDSIMGLLVVSRAMQAGWRVTARHALQHQTIAELAAVAEPVTADAARLGAETELHTVPLTPVQRWFFDHELDHPGHWNLNVSLAVVGVVDVPLLAGHLRLAFGQLVARHDALRTRFQRNESGAWTAEVLPVDQTPPVSVEVVTVDPGLDWETTLARKAAAAQDFDLSAPPLLRGVLVDGGHPDRVRLLLIGHHLIVDGVSWRILLDDLRTGVAEAANGRPVRLPAPTTSSGAWARTLVGLAGSAGVTEELDYWRAQHRAGAGLAPDAVADVDAAPAFAREADLVHLTVSLTAEATGRLLREASQAYHTHIDDLLLTAVGRAFTAYTGRDQLLLAVESHGREQQLADNVDLSGTVGWFTAIAPLLLRMPDPADGPGAALLSVKQQRRAIPNRGLGYGLLRHLHPVHGPELAALPQPQISFNNLGQLDSMVSAGANGPNWTFAPEADVATHHPSGRRPYLIDVTATIEGGRLHLRFSYCPTHHQNATLRTIAASALRELDDLIAHCCEADRSVLSASDFPEAGLDQAQLDLLLQSIG